MWDSILRSLLRLAEPVGLAWMGLILLSVMLWRRRQWLPMVLSAALALLITIVGGTGFSSWLLWRMETPWTKFRIDQTPAADAVVVLGGGAEPSLHEIGGVRLTRAGDRITTGLELMRLGRAPAMVVSGGFSTIGGVKKVEGDLIKARLASWNLPAAWEIVSLGVSADTHDEALRLVPVARKRGWKRILLVTSACHMRRSVAVFRAAGFDPVPAPCNFLVAGSAVPLGFQIGIPGYGGFERLAVWMHEVAGWEVYRIRGWLEVPRKSTASE